MPRESANVTPRLLDRMRDVESRWPERDTADVWDQTTRVPVEPSARRPEYLIVVGGPLAKALRAAAKATGESVPDYTRHVLAKSLARWMKPVKKRRSLPSESKTAPTCSWAERSGTHEDSG